MDCKFCKIGKVTPCKCGCAENGRSTYVCSNPDCTGDEFEILGIKQIETGNSFGNFKRKLKKYNLMKVNTNDAHPTNLPNLPPYFYGT